MDEQSFHIRIPKRWMRISVIAGMTALVIVPLTAVATHGFSDVPSTNTFHADIAWLKDSGVTKGCNPPANTEYCPDDPVTREQMAAFMRRLAEFQVVDAGTLDGKAGASYNNPVVNARAGSQTIPAFQAEQLAQLSITTPAPGGLVIDAVVVLTGPTETTVAWIQVDNTTCTSSAATLESVMFGLFGQSANAVTGSITGTASVPAGAHTVTFCGRSVSAAASDVIAASLVAEYSTSVTKTGSLFSAGLLESLGMPSE